MKECYVCSRPAKVIASGNIPYCLTCYPKPAIALPTKQVEDMPAYLEGLKLYDEGGIAIPAVQAVPRKFRVRYRKGNDPAMVEQLIHEAMDEKELIDSLWCNPAFNPPTKLCRDGNGPSKNMPGNIFWTLVQEGTPVKHPTSWRLRDSDPISKDTTWKMLDDPHSWFKSPIYPTSSDIDTDWLKRMFLLWDEVVDNDT